MKWAGPSKTWLIAWSLLICLIACLAAAGNPAECGEIMAENDTRHLNAEDSIQEMLRHSALAPFAEHMLPMPQNVASNVPFREIGSLMPWRNHITPEVVLEGMNRLIDDSGKGLKVFYQFYAIPPASDQTGLFFFRGRPDAPFALICPGGGFRYVGSLHEGFPLALELNRHGFNAFVLQYRTDGERIACVDMGKALAWIFRNARELRVNTAGYSVWGGSAGGRMAADLGSYGPIALGAGDLPKPCCVVMAYTGHDWITENEPPTFAVVSNDDPIASAYVMNERIKALKRDGIDADIMIFNHAGHGFGNGFGTDAQGWMDKAINFWQKQLDKLEG